MLTISRTGNVADVIASARNIPTGVIPYAAATALTRTAKAGQAEIVAKMPSVFDRPTRYTLNALRIQPATKDKLTASVSVKNQVSSGTRPESYLLPEVQGGPRSEKRFERALRYSGILSAGQRVMPGDATALDANGNVSAREISRVLSTLKKVKATSSTRDRKTGKKLKKGRALANDLFVGQPMSGTGPLARPRAGTVQGIYRREGRRIRPLFIFTNNVPAYRRRLDFDGTVERVVRERFAKEFNAAAQSILTRRR